MPFDLIHHHDKNAAALTMDQIAESCPAAFAENPAPVTSEKYGFVSTKAAIDILTDNGFYPVRAIQKPSRKNESVMFNEHMITFAAPKLYDGTGERGELILYNSHNARSSLKLFAGIFRFVCSNGCIAGDGFQAKLRHSKLTANGFNDLVQQQADALPDVMDRIENLKSVEWTPNKILDFSYNAAALRWELDPNAAIAETTEAENLRGAFATKQTIHEIGNVARRYDDIGSDAWRVFNRAQESLVRGGVRIRSYSKSAPWGKDRKAKAVTSLAESVRINRELWDLADAMA